MTPNATDLHEMRATDQSGSAFLTCSPFMSQNYTQTTLILCLSRDSTCKNALFAFWALLLLSSNIFPIASAHFIFFAKSTSNHFASTERMMFDTAATRLFHHISVRSVHSSLGIHMSIKQSGAHFGIPSSIFFAFSIHISYICLNYNFSFCYFFFY